MNDKRNASAAERLKADADGQVDMKLLLEVVLKLSTDLNVMQRHLAANTSMTRESLEWQESSQARQTATDEKLDALVSSSAEMIDLFQSGKKGVKFFQGTGRVLFKLATWLIPLLTVWGAIVAIMHGQPPRGRE